MYFDPHNINPETLVIEREDQEAKMEAVRRLQEADPRFFLYLLYVGAGHKPSEAAHKVYGDTPPCKSAFSNKRRRIRNEYLATRETLRTPLCHPNRRSPSD